MKNKKSPFKQKTFKTKTKKSFQPIVSPEEQLLIENFMQNSPINKIVLSDYNLDKPLVTAEEQTAIDNYYNTQASNYVKRWIQTYTCKKFFPLDPNIDDIDIVDIAHALSNLCRFTGHVREFYSIAQHSVLVSYLCDYPDRLYGLLHDASEGYLVDIPTPLKKAPQFSFYKEAEHKLQSMIYNKFGLSDPEPPSVKRADILMLATESADLMAPLHSEWELPCKPLPMNIKPLPPKEAKSLFLGRFYELTGK